MSKYTDFKNMVLGKSYDVDGYYGAQCWDGYAYYCKYLGIPICHCTVTGYVRDIYNQRKSNGILNYCKEVTELQAGDIVIFKVVAGITPYSHIAIFDHDAGNGYGYFLGQNQGGTNGCFNIVKLPYSALYEYGLRPKVLNSVEPAVYKWDNDAVLKTGDIVKSGSCHIKSISGNNIDVSELGCIIHANDLGESSNTKDGKVDEVLSSTKAMVYLKQCSVIDVDGAKNLVQVKGRNTGRLYWVKPEKLYRKV